MNFSVNNNMASAMTLSNLSNTQSEMQNAVAQLSSGLRINKAADDAAGLAISQKMSAQINGLNQASRNAQDGISMIQTAEGALGQSQQILQSMRTLAVQASSDTATATDRAQIQKVMDQLSQQLTQNSNTTQFNTMHVLTGQFASGANNINIQVGANKGETTSFNIAAADAYSLGVTREYATFSAGSDTAGAPTTTGTAPTGANTTITASNAATDISNIGTNIDAGASYKLVYNSSFDASKNLVSDTLQLQDSAGNNIGAAVDLTKATSATVTVGDVADGISFNINLKNVASTAAGAGKGAMGETATAAGTLTQIDTINFSAPATAASHAATSANGWTANATAGISVLNQSDAENAMSSIDNAIQTISGQRANLGALQNRLTYSQSNVQNSSQNLTTAKSNITDVNMAQEMSQFTQMNVLQQAGASILAQANQMPQVILKLLQ